MNTITAKDVRALSEKRGCSLMVAKEILVKEQFRQSVRQAKTLDELKPAIEYILHKLYVGE